MNFPQVEWNFFVLGSCRLFHVTAEGFFDSCFFPVKASNQNIVETVKSEILI
jgi:hypothetical protein